MNCNKRITIYGAYYPDIVLSKLRLIRDFLVRNDYLETILVQNYLDNLLPSEILQFKITSPSRFAFKKSTYLVEISDLNIFVFTFMDTTQTGITEELNHALANNMYNFLIYTEFNVISGIRAISSLTYGRLEDIGLELERYIIPVPQDNDQLLCDWVYQGVLDFHLINWQ